VSWRDRVSLHAQYFCALAAAGDTADDKEKKVKLLPECQRELQHAQRVLQAKEFDLGQDQGGGDLPSLPLAVDPPRGAPALQADLAEAPSKVLVAAFGKAMELASAAPSASASGWACCESREKGLLRC
jgi:hypothetical protein